jgi:GNAT superfamily N-acetyltransferase
MIKGINALSGQKAAVKIFSDAFSEDTLFRFAFPDAEQRYRLTGIMYEFVVYELVPMMRLKLKGLYVKEKLVAVGVYTTPESKTEWTKNLDKAINKMREKAKDESISMIGGYSMKSRKFKIEEPHFYFNELAVSPGEQGKGYGKAMFEYVESQCLKHPAAKGIGLDTPNPDNVKIYKHLGYKVTHKFKFFDLTGYTMYKKIK